GPEERFVLACGDGDARGGRLLLLDAATGRAVFETRTGLAIEGSSERAVPLGAIVGRPAAVDVDTDGFVDSIWFGDALGRLFRMWTPATAPPGARTWTP